MFSGRPSSYLELEEKNGNALRNIQKHWKEAPEFYHLQE